MPLYFIISLLASIIGAICGIGGGAIIKPVLDLFALDDISTISFLSGCTVLAMSLYSVANTALQKERAIDFRFCTPIAVGAALGGVLGKVLFEAILYVSANPQLVGRAQSICMIAITATTFVYTLFKGRIKSLHVRKMLPRIVIGLALGILSSFLGIGGGPIKLVTFFFFFSMDTKTAAQYSLYTILVSQVASLLTSWLTGSIPSFNTMSLVWMVAGGILGGVIGRALAKKISNKSTDAVFLAAMGAIICICVYNMR